MAIFRIPDRHVFPNPELADRSGLLGVGGDLQPDRLRLAYRSGIFPWYGPNDPICWFSPDPRAVLYASDLHIQRSLRKRIRQRPYTITIDTAFRDVIEACASAARPGQDATWIVPDMIAAYCTLHEQGDAHSFEARDTDGRVVGGFYGVCVGGLFCGESMFAHAPDASKIAFVHGVLAMRRFGIDLIDCQQQTAHLARFGAQLISRRAYLQALGERRERSAPTGAWSWPDDLDVVHEIDAYD